MAKIQTDKQRKLVKLLSENLGREKPMTMLEMMLAAGYEESSAKQQITISGRHPRRARSDRESDDRPPRARHQRDGQEDAESEAPRPHRRPGQADEEHPAPRGQGYRAAGHVVSGFNYLSPSDTDHQANR
jgi:hypothetical protein